MMKWIQDELATISCDYCGSTEVSRKIIRLDGMRVVECAICGLAYLNPRPRNEFIHRFYDEDYFTGAKARSGEGGLTVKLTCDNEDNIDLRKVPRKLEIVSKQAGNLSGESILEIGCATGDLLLFLKAMGAEVTGLEISDFAANIARKRSLNVITGTIDEYREQPKAQSSFDIVMAFEVIEHVLSPTGFMRDVARLLRDGGFLVLSTPNYACAHRFGKGWNGFRTSFEHLYFFNLDVLRRMAFKCGFTLTYWETSMDSGGPPQNHANRYVELQKNRLIKLSYFLNEYTLPKAVKKFIKKDPGYLPYGNGHNLIAIFKKNEPGAHQHDEMHFDHRRER